MYKHASFINTLTILSEGAVGVRELGPWTNGGGEFTGEWGNEGVIFDQVFFSKVAGTERNKSMW